MHHFQLLSSVLGLIFLVIKSSFSLLLFSLGDMGYVNYVGQMFIWSQVSQLQNLWMGRDHVRLLESSLFVTFPWVRAGIIKQHDLRLALHQRALGHW
jgi:hypothetical protein